MNVNHCRSLLCIHTLPSYLFHSMHSTMKTRSCSKRKLITIDDDDEDIVVEKVVPRSSRSLTQSAKTSRLMQCAIVEKNDSKQSDLFSSRWKPEKIDELAVHPKKLKELGGWIQNRKASVKCLLLTGPAGSGKSVSTQILAAKENFNVVEWECEENLDIIQYGDNAYIKKESEVTAFFKFLRSNPVSIDNPKSVILFIDYIPSQCYTDLFAFHNGLRSALAVCRLPIVFCLSDCASYKSSPDWLFPPHILNELSIDRLKFNPIATTFMKKALNRVMGKLGLFANVKFLDKIIEASEGDVRSAINMIQFCYSGKSQPVFCSSLESASNDEFFHMIGRLLYAKRLKGVFPTSPLLPTSLQFNPTERDVNSILEMSSTGFNTVMSFLHHHEPHFSPSISNTRRCLDAISLSDSLSIKWDEERRNEEYAVQISARATMFYNHGTLHKVERHNFTKPQSTMVDKEISRVTDQLHQVVHMVRRGSDAMALEFPMMSHMKLVVDPSQLDLVSYLTRPISFSFNRGRSQWDSLRRQPDSTMRGGNCIVASDDGQSALATPFSVLDTDCDDEMDDVIIEDSDDDRMSVDSFDTTL